MTDSRKSKLSFEILGDLAVSLAAAVCLFCLLVFLALHIADSFVYSQNIEMTDIDLDYMTSRIFSLGAIISVLVFVMLFLFLLGQRLSYIPKIAKGIEALHSGEEHTVPVEGNDELGELARSINYISETQRRVRAEEAALQSEKEELIRSLSHDIRTPLTSIMSYSELLTSGDLPEAERRNYLELIRKKSLQIKELTDILLDGGARKLEHFDDARLLFCQLVDEFEYSLEDDFSIEAKVTLSPFAGNFDVRELQRVFDNLASNIRKYADRQSPVAISLSLAEGKLTLSQENRIRADIEKSESYGIGLKSIRRIAGLYGGSACVEEEHGIFRITVVFTDFS